MRKCFATLLLLTLLSVRSGAPARAAEPMEFIRVSPDGWNFETARSHKRFIPFGGSAVFAYSGPSGASWLNYMSQPTWDPVTIRKVFEGAHSANLNLMKVFVGLVWTVNDPQTNDTIRFTTMSPPLLERLDQVFQIARDTNVYISLCPAEWGVGWNQWFLNGGNFFGLGPEDGPGVDAYAVYRNFWKIIAERYKNEPALFSYNLAVEFYMPGGNWRANKMDLDGNNQDIGTWWYMFNEEWGIPHWRQWLSDQYANVAALNQAWGTAYASFSEITQPDIVWQGSGYSKPQRMIGDYNSFKEWVSYLFLKNQADAIRSVDKGHMITAGQHPQHPAIGWAGSAMYHAGIAPKELDFLDYTTLHSYTSSATDVNGLHGAILAARFAHYPGKPLILEELGTLVNNQQASLAGATAIVTALAGHVSGYQLWVLGQTETDWGPLGLDYALNDWGREWKKLAEPGGVVATLPLARTPAQKIFKLERINGMCPVQQTAMINVLNNWSAYPQPVEFDWPLNPAIAKIRPVPVHTGVPPSQWKNY